MNLSIHLPDPLISKLDAYAAALAKSRSSVVREAVSEYLLQRAVTVWPTELAQWMSPTETTETGDQPTTGAWPNVDAIRAIREEANANMAQRAVQA
jgi:predicted transcriptional regulator